VKASSKKKHAAAKKQSAHPLNKIASVGNRNQIALQALAQAIPYTQKMQSSMHAPLLNTPLKFALIISLAIHTFLLTIHFVNPNALKDFTNFAGLEVVLVNSQSSQKPMQAQKLAQLSIDGGGNTDEDRSAKTPFPDAESGQMASLESFEERIKSLEARAHQLIAQTRAFDVMPVNQQQVEADPLQEKTGQQTEMSEAKKIEMMRLQAEVDQQWEAYQKRPRRKFIGSRTEEFWLARYIDNWRQKIEKVGTQNFPQVASARNGDQRMYGSLQLTVSIRSSGRVEKIEIDRSSGSKALDQAAISIVEMSAPFSQFTDEMRKDLDILSITRTWTFERNALVTTATGLQR